ncbi:MAG: Clp protease ClpP [Proteobacteria bacterium]|nr:Clp protease ClpP [Pseudomonadota bacterium]
MKMKNNNPRLMNSAASAGDGSGSSWYSIRNAAEGKPDAPIEVFLYDQIGDWGIRAADFIRDLNAVDDGKRPVVVAINSIGGDVWDGIAINNVLCRMGERVTARIDGLAASIASVIAMGAHKVVMPDNAMLMIHNPATVAVGESGDLRDVADFMDKAKHCLIACYRVKASGVDVETLSKMMDETTWLTAQEALALGFADEILPTVKMQASAAMTAAVGRIGNAPAALMAALKNSAEIVPPDLPPEPVPVIQPVDTVAMAALAAELCNSAQLPSVAVMRVVAVSALASEQAVRNSVNEAIAIRDMTLTAKLPEMAASLIAAGISIDAARERLFNKLVTAAGEELDATPPDETPAKPVNSGPNAHSIYAQRRTTAANPITIRGLS